MWSESVLLTGDTLLCTPIMRLLLVCVMAIGDFPNKQSLSLTNHPVLYDQNGKKRMLVVYSNSANVLQQQKSHQSALVNDWM